MSTKLNGLSSNKVEVGMHEKLKGLFLVGAAATILWASAATANSVELGWTEGPPCSKVEWRNDGFLNLPSPTVTKWPQRIYTIVHYTPSRVVSAENLLACAAQGSPPAFIACMGSAILSSSIEIQGRCT